MGGGTSRFAGSGTLKKLVSAAGLPLEVDDDISQDQLQNPGKVGHRSAPAVVDVTHFDMSCPGFVH